MRTIENRYYKHTEPDLVLMSGLCLPIDDDGVVRGTIFVSCSFHPAVSPNYRPDLFVGCGFVDCSL